MASRRVACGFRRRARAAICEHGGVPITHENREWLTLPEVAEQLGLSEGKVRRLLEERQLLASRIGCEPCVPAVFLRDGAPVPGLRGTITLLADTGIADDEIMAWLLGEDETLGAAPADALREGRKTQVRHSVQLLAI